MAVAYPNNSEASGIWSRPWKHNEWGTGAPNNSNDGLFMFHNQGALLETTRSSIHLLDDRELSTCNSGNAAATVNAGKIFCVGGSFQYTTAGNYNRSVDWLLEIWACARGKAHH